jgi:hypothetical protein
MYLTAFSLGLLTLAPAPSSSPAATRQEPQTRSTPARPADTVAQDVEILRRLLVKSVRGGITAEPAAAPSHSLLNLPPDSAIALSGIVQDLYVQNWITALDGGPSVAASNGFHVPGTGAFFTMDISVPLKPVPAAGQTPATKGQGATDEWADMKREVQGGGAKSSSVVGLYVPQIASNPAYVKFSGSVGFALDEDAIERAVERVLETLAKYGARIEGLETGESITVCLHVTGSGAGSEHWPLITGSTDSAGQIDLFRVGQPFYNLEPQTASGPERRVVIQLGKLPLEQLAARGANASEAKARALVHSY